MNHAVPIVIRTKLCPPRLPGVRVERRRLLQRLEAGSDRRLTLISAPAGYGKSTLAAHWLERRTGRSAWVSLDPGDSDPRRFMRYLVAAFHASLPGSLPRTESLLGAIEDVPWSYLTDVLVSELTELDEEIVVALDDYQTIASDEVQNMVVRLVENIPPTMRLLVLSRSDPPWPLGRWRAKRWLAEVRQQLLRFDGDEVRAYFAGSVPVELSEEHLETLTRKTEGWAVGIQLAGLSIASADNPQESIRRFSGSDRLIADYLVEEVLATQPPEVRELLAATAPLERFCAPLCAHLLPGTAAARNATALLDRLERANLFLVPLDTERRWFRYHHLFGQLLAHHLPEAASRDYRHDIERRAAAWFAGEGFVKDSLRLWIEAGDLDTAARYFGSQLHAVLEEDHSRRLLALLLDLFPPGAEHGRLPLLVASAYRAHTRWDGRTMESLLDEADACLEDDPAAPAEFGPDIDALRAFVLYWRGEAARALVHTDRAIERLPEDDRGLARAFAGIYKGGALHLSGRHEEAVSFLNEAIDSENARGGRRSEGMMTALAFVHLYANDLTASRLVAQRIIDAHETKQVPAVWFSQATLQLGIVALERDLLDEATGHFLRVADMRYLANSRIYQEALLGLALIAERRGDREALAKWTHAARAWAVEVQDAGALALSDSFEWRLAARSGQAVPMAPAPLPAVDVSSLWFEVPSITHAEILVCHPTAEIRHGALPYVERMLEVMESGGNVRQALRLAVPRALALAEADRRDDALDELARALERAEPQQSVRPFLGGGERACRLLEELSKRRGRTGFLGRVLEAAAIGGAATTRPQPGAASVAKLTSRESETLGLVAEHLTNKEIASRLNLSESAVNKRLIGIYAKLEVGDRLEAVAVAMARGLL